MNIVILDAQLANPGDLSWSHIEKLGTLTTHDTTSPDQVIERSRDADILIVNKIVLGRKEFELLPNLKQVCLLATGFDNIDIDEARANNITICNVPSYSVDSVAQHVLALLLTATNHIAHHNNSVQQGHWYKEQWSYTLRPIRGLSGKIFGIYGLGKIGTKVAELARALGMHILVTTRRKISHEEAINQVSLQELFSNSDVISLHVPLTKDNHGIINEELLAHTKKDAILINTARGGLINEHDLRDHLLSHPLFFAALDVLSKEPPTANHPLIGLHNCLLTPHHAWANIDARRSLINIVAQNIDAFINGDPINVVGR